jgi:hypothetical protein
MKKAVVLMKGRKYNLCCDVEFLHDFMNYVLLDTRHTNEIKIIFQQICEGLKSRKYGDEPYSTKALKPFLNNDNDRIICHVKKMKNEKQHIIMSELFLHKKTEGIDKKLNIRYKTVSEYEYEIISSN